MLLVSQKDVSVKFVGKYVTTMLLSVMTLLCTNNFTLRNFCEIDYWSLHGHRKFPQNMTYIYVFYLCDFLFSRFTYYSTHFVNFVHVFILAVLKGKG